MQKLLLFFFLTTAMCSSLFSQTCDLDFENWENASTNNLPSGWQTIDGYVGDIPANTYNGLQFAGMNDLGDQWIVEPLTCPGEICFYWRASSGGANYDVDIDWSADNGTNWTTEQTISLTGNNSPTTYTQICVDLPDENYLAPFTGILARLHMSRRVNGSLYFDDVCMNRGACVLTPTQLTFSDLQSGCLQQDTPFSITVCATDAGENTDVSYNADIIVSGTNLSGTTTQTAVNGCAQFTDLEVSAAGSYTLSATSGGLSGSSNSITIDDMCPLTAELKVVSYNLLNFPSGRDDCGASNTVIPSRWDSLQIILNYIKPDVLMVCELQTELGADLILSDALNVGGISNYARANFVLNQSSGGTDLNNAFFYNTDKMTLYSQSEVTTNVRDIGEYTVFLNDPNLGTHQDTVFIDFYTAHLKAGSTASDVASRAVQCNSLQSHVDAKLTERNAIVGGDFNFYGSVEGGYQALLSGTYPFNDPINMPGSWDNNGSFSAVHTQSTRSFNTAPLDCGATGGMDSRFDFLLNSTPIMNGTKNVIYTPGSYQALGNSGNLFNSDINNTGNNSEVPREVLYALRNTSDHLPVIMELGVIFPEVVLPFDLLSFSVNAEKDNAVLEWEIADENEDLDFFTIQKSRNRGSFLDIKKIQKTVETIYSSTEKLAAGTTYYRLKSTEFDGTISYSQVKSLTKKGMDLYVFPNPVRDVLNVEMRGEVSSNNGVEIRVFDAFGRIIFNEKIMTLNDVDVSTNDWNSGIYVVEVKIGEERFTQRIVK